jgi:hypothetical protein
MIDPSTGACVYIEELDEGSSVGLEVVNDQIAIAGLFKLRYELEDNIVTSSIYEDIYFALREKIIVSNTKDPSTTSLHLYPNPVNDWLLLGDLFQDDTFVYNIQGVLMRHIPAYTSKIDVSPLPQGMYFIMTSSGNAKGKFLKL